MKKINNIFPYLYLNKALNLQVGDNSPFLLNETVIPVLEIGNTLRKTRMIVVSPVDAGGTGWFSLTGGAVSSGVVPLNKRWLVKSIAFTGSGTYTINKIGIRSSNNALPYDFPLIEFTAATSYAWLLPNDFWMESQDIIRFNVASYTSMNLQAYIIVEEYESSGRVAIG